MELKVLDKSRKWIGIIDCFKSLIWTRRYYECGDFELYIQASDETLALLRQGYYVARDDDDMVCVIESITIQSNAEDGDYITATGRCLKSILERRIVWNQTNIYGKAEQSIRKLIETNIISPSDTARQIPNFKLGPLVGLDNHLEKQIAGDNLYDAILAICKTYEYGFEIVLEDGDFVFYLVKGIDRTYNQTENPYAVFSYEFDNLPKSNYYHDYSTYKNVALIAGEGEGVDRPTATIANVRGLDRRELYVDASDVSTNNGEIGSVVYGNLLVERGAEALAETVSAESFDGEIETAGQYEYKKDYAVGDKVQIKNEFGVEATAIILEAVECEDETGYHMVPTFSTWEV